MRLQRSTARTVTLLVATATVLALAVGYPAPGLSGRAEQAYTPGAAGVGDPYYPLDGNGGYDVRQYFLNLAYEPDTDRLTGVAVIRATATQDLSRFNLDLDGLRVGAIGVDRVRAGWTRHGDELTVTPQHGIDDGSRFSVRVLYGGVPETLDEFGASGFFHTDDGTLVAGEPHVADTWYPVNDHPSDKASYRFRITVPAGLEAIANGRLLSSRTRSGHTTWTWLAKEPMASYLATTTIGEFDLRAYRAAGLPLWDALDPDLYDVAALPRTGEQFALSQVADNGPTYKRLMHTIQVPPAGGQLSAWIDRGTEVDWDYVAVEAHTVGEDDWTTLPDLNGHTSGDTGFSCPFWLELHPFLRHYQTVRSGSCEPTGRTGDWHAATGQSDGYERWRMDLGDFAGERIKVAISYVSDDVVQGTGVYVDDVTGPRGQGTTSFEADADPMDGWTVPGAPPTSDTNENDWMVGTVADLPPTAGERVDASFDRHGDILRFLRSSFGPYPFNAAGGVVDDTEELGFALENQTRPIYPSNYFGTPAEGDSVVVHELAHQWFGDSLALERWRDIWLNEGFATYAEWLWSEREGFDTRAEIFDFLIGIPEDDDLWQLEIGDPGPDQLFDFPVYVRGALTLEALRRTVGNADFNAILKSWARQHEGGNVTTRQFIALAERISGQQLDAFFNAWLYTVGRPDAPLQAAARARDGSSATPRPLIALTHRLGVPSLAAGH